MYIQTFQHMLEAWNAGFWISYQTYILDQCCSSVWCTFLSLVTHVSNNIAQNILLQTMRQHAEGWRNTVCQWALVLPHWTEQATKAMASAGNRAICWTCVCGVEFVLLLLLCSSIIPLCCFSSSLPLARASCWSDSACCSLSRMHSSSCACCLNLASIDSRRAFRSACKTY